MKIIWYNFNLSDLSDQICLQIKLLSDSSALRIFLYSHSPKTKQESLDLYVSLEADLTVLLFRCVNYCFVFKITKLYFRLNMKQKSAHEELKGCPKLTKLFSFWVVCKVEHSFLQDWCTHTSTAWTTGSWSKCVVTDCMRVPHPI